jgi:hypothetical protein
MEARRARFKERGQLFGFFCLPRGIGHGLLCGLRGRPVDRRHYRGQHHFGRRFNLCAWETVVGAERPDLSPTSPAGRRSTQLATSEVREPETHVLRPAVRR